MKANKDKKENTFDVEQIAHPEHQREDDRRKEAVRGIHLCQHRGMDLPSREGPPEG